MKNISVYIKGGTKKTLILDKPLVTYASLLKVNEVTVFWKFKNITDAIDNRKFIINNNEKTFEEGYWDFEQIKERLKGEKLELSMNVHNNTCNIINKTGTVVNLKKFGMLLGFPENHLLKNTTNTITSPNPVDVNHALRYLHDSVR